MKFKDIADYLDTQHNLAVDGLMENPKFLDMYEKFGLPLYDKAKPKMTTESELDTGSYPHFSIKSKLELMCGTLRVTTYASHRRYGGTKGNGSYEVVISAYMTYPDALGDWKYYREIAGGRVERFSRLVMDINPSTADEAEFRKKTPRTYNAVINRFLPIVEKYDMFSQSNRLNHIEKFRDILNITALMVIQHESGEKTIAKALLPPYKSRVSHLERLKVIMKKWDEITKDLEVGN
jgi:hypothetical protein